MNSKIIGLIIIALLLVCARGVFAADGILSPAESWKKIDGGAFVLDVRTPQEYAEGHIANSVLIPYDEVADRVSELGVDKTRQIILYCASGRRAAKALQTLRGLGFQNVYNAGGYDELNETRRPGQKSDLK